MFLVLNNEPYYFAISIIIKENWNGSILNVSVDIELFRHICMNIQFMGSVLP